MFKTGIALFDHVRFYSPISILTINTCSKSSSRLFPRKLCTRQFVEMSVWWAENA